MKPDEPTPDFLYAPSSSMKHDATPIKPCPFCGTKQGNGQWTMTNGFREVQCSCGASAPLERWNKERAEKAERQPKTYESLRESIEILGSDLPANDANTPFIAGILDDLVEKLAALEERVEANQQTLKSLCDIHP